MASIERITPCLWFDDEAEAAAHFYIDIFPNSGITHVRHYSDAGREMHKRPAGSVMTVEFKLDGCAFTALNGGPVFSFNEAISLQVNCADQDEIDHYWNALSAGGPPESQQCGWLKDRYGLSWQIVPESMNDICGDAESEGAKRAMEAMLSMKKLDIAALRRAHAGES